jgi:hypothetical protein
MDLVPILGRSKRFFSIKFHITSYEMGTSGSFSEIKRPEREATINLHLLLRLTVRQEISLLSYMYL